MTVSLSIDTGLHFAVSFTITKAFCNLDVTLKMDYNIDRMISCRRETDFNSFPGCQGQLLTEVQQQSVKKRSCNGTLLLFTGPAAVCGVLFFVHAAGFIGITSHIKAYKCMHKLTLGRLLRD